MTKREVKLVMCICDRCGASAQGENETPLGWAKLSVYIMAADDTGLQTEHADLCPPCLKLLSKWRDGIGAGRKGLTKALKQRAEI